MAINVNRVTLGFNVKSYNNQYFFRAVNCPVGTVLGDGSTLICKAGGTAWFVAPASTEVTSAFGNIPGTFSGGDAPLITLPCCWTDLRNRMVESGYTPSEWFVPSLLQTQNPGYCCRVYWSYTNGIYWTSKETSGGGACTFNFSNGLPAYKLKGCLYSVRAFKTISY